MHETCQPDAEDVQHNQREGQIGKRCMQLADQALPAFDAFGCFSFGLSIGVRDNRRLAGERNVAQVAIGDQPCHDRAGKAD